MEPHRSNIKLFITDNKAFVSPIPIKPICRPSGLENNSPEHNADCRQINAYIQRDWGYIAFTLGWT